MINKSKKKISLIYYSQTYCIINIKAFLGIQSIYVLLHSMQQFNLCIINYNLCINFKAFLGIQSICFTCITYLVCNNSISISYYYLARHLSVHMQKHKSH